MYGCVYLVTNVLNGKLYVGQTARKPDMRWKEHIYYNSPTLPLGRAIKKYGRENFTFRIIRYRPTRELLDVSECFYIKFFNTMKNGYNIKEGGAQGKHTAETRARIGEAGRGRKFSTDCVRARAAKLKVWRSEHDHRPMLGRKHSEATKAKLRLAKTPEHCALVWAKIRANRAKRTD